MKIKVQIDPAKKKREIAPISISFENNGTTYITGINFEFFKLFDFSKNTSSVSFDFLLFSSIVYNTDRFIERKSFSFDGWVRELEINIPVNNLEVWEGVKTGLEKCIGFLTGDIWKFHFEKIEIDPIYEHNNLRRLEIPNYNMEDYNYVSLFSGGLDSLVGAIDILEKEDLRKVLFVSHHDLPGPLKDQQGLINILKNRYESKFDWISVGVGLKRQTVQISDPSFNYENTFRSRSILFMGIGIYLANNISNDIDLVVPENGTISLNIPLSPSRRSSCSTRTTHPFHIQQLNMILKKMGLNNTIFNPYEFCTKGELVANCFNQNVLDELINISVSCGKRGHRIYWNRRTGTDHCGFCMPCFYRRAALHKIGKDDKNEYGINIFDPSETENISASDFKMLEMFIGSNSSKNQILSRLLINGNLELDKLDNYIETIEKTITEVQTWIQEGQFN